MITINIAKDFSDTPGARYIKEGDFSGELFRQTFLEKHFSDSQANYPIQIVLDGVEGYATSFLEEAFGGLARQFGKEKVIKRLQFISKEDPLLVSEIESYIQNCDGKQK